MKRTIATLIAGLFATAAFAQTPAPAKTTTTAATPSAVKTDAKADVQAAKADAQAAKADAKDAKASAKLAMHRKHKAKHHAVKKEAAKDTTVAADTTAPVAK
jgi:hypothetical protein